MFPLRVRKHCVRIIDILSHFPRLVPHYKQIKYSNDIITKTNLFPPQNYLNESLKYLDKVYPNSSGGSANATSGAAANPAKTAAASLAPPSATPTAAAATSASSAMILPDTKPIFVDTKALLGQQMQEHK